MHREKDREKKKSRNASITTDTKITLFIKGPSESAVSSHPTPKLQLRGEKMQVSGQGRDGTGRMTTQDDLPQNQNSAVVQSEETAPNNSEQPQKHILVKTLRYAQCCPARATPASVVLRVRGDGKAVRA